MKIKIEVDMDPKELREFLGFPDVAGLQKEAVKTIMKNMKSGADGFEPVTLLKQWVPNSILDNADLQGLIKRVLGSASFSDDSAVIEDE